LPTLSLSLVIVIAAGAAASAFGPGQVQGFPFCEFYAFFAALPIQKCPRLGTRLSAGRIEDLPWALGQFSVAK